MKKPKYKQSKLLQVYQDLLEEYPKKISKEAILGGSMGLYLMGFKPQRTKDIDIILPRGLFSSSKLLKLGLEEDEDSGSGIRDFVHGGKTIVVFPTKFQGYTIDIFLVKKPRFVTIIKKGVQYKVNRAQEILEFKALFEENRSKQKLKSQGRTNISPKALKAWEDDLPF